jgi:hypothetical protein
MLTGFSGVSRPAGVIRIVTLVIFVVILVILMREAA